jgi:S1-C subfamily serine protease
MSRRLSVAVFLLLCFTTEARAGPPWLERPAAFPTGENRASSQGRIIGSAADYVQTLNRPVAISGIGASVRNGRTKLIDGHEVSGAEVVDVASEGPAASAAIESCGMAAKAAPLRARGVFAIILTPVIPLLQAIHHSSTFDDSDVIFAADGERIRNAVDLEDRVQSLARGDRVYLTIARRGRRVQICIAASP